MSKIEPDGTCHGKNRSGNPCKFVPSKGNTMCKWHGGSLPNMKQMAAVNVAKDQKLSELKKRLARRSGERLQVIEELETAAIEATTLRELCREAVEDLWATGSIRYEGKTGEQLRAEVALYERMLNNSVSIYEKILKLGIAERRLELDKQKALIVATVFREVLGELKLSREQTLRASKLFSQKMLQISAEPE